MTEENVVSTTLKDAEEIRVIHAFRRIKSLQFGEMTVAVSHSKMVKLWTTDKWFIDEKKGQLREQEVKP